MNNTKGCDEIGTISTFGDGWYKNKENIAYPLLRPGPYSIDIYLENEKKETGCKFHIEGIYIFIHGENLKHYFYSAEIKPRERKYSSPNLIENEVTVLECNDRKFRGHLITDCDLREDDSSSKISFGNTKNIKIDFVARGNISGNDFFHKKKDIFSNIADRFLSGIMKFSPLSDYSYDPR